jgi:hypothetical protein
MNFYLIRYNENGTNREKSTKVVGCLINPKDGKRLGIQEDLIFVPLELIREDSFDFPVILW